MKLPLSAPRKKYSFHYGGRSEREGSLRSPAPAVLRAPVVENFYTTRGQWPYRPASKERAMTNRPVIIYDFNFLGIHINERKNKQRKSA